MRAFVVPAGWSLERFTRGDAEVIQLTRPDWVVEVTGELDTFLDHVEMREGVYFRRAQVAGRNVLAQDLAAAARDPHFVAALDLAVSASQWLVAELLGEQDEQTESEAA